MELLLLFTLKLLDCSIGTFKNIFMIKGKNFLSSLCNTVAMYFYLTMLTNLNKNTTIQGIIVICIATFIGSILPQLVSDKLSKDNAWVFNITPSTNELGKYLADDLRDNNIPIHTFKGYNDNKEQVLCIKAFSESKIDSILLEQLIPKECKYHIMELKHYNQN